MHHNAHSFEFWIDMRPLGSNYSKSHKLIIIKKAKMQSPMHTLKHSRAASHLTRKQRESNHAERLYQYSWSCILRMQRGMREYAEYVTVE